MAADEGGPSSVPEGAERPWARDALAWGGLVAYALAFLVLHDVLGPAAPALSLIPAVAGAFLLGMRGGVLLSLVLVPLNSLLLHLAEDTSWSAAAGLSASLVLVATAAVVGWLGERFARSEQGAGPAGSEDIPRSRAELVERTVQCLDDAALVLSADPSPVVLDCNRAAGLAFGWRKPDLVGRDAGSLFASPEEAARFLDEARPAADRLGHAAFVRSRMRRRGGGEFTAEHTLLPLSSDAGQRTGWLDIVRDRSAQARLQRRLAESEARYRELADALPLPLFEADAGGRLTYANVAALAALGLAPRDVTRRPALAKALGAEGDEPLQRELARALHGHPAPPAAHRLRRRDGSALDATLHLGAAVRRGEVVGLRGVLVPLSGGAGRGRRAPAEGPAGRGAEG